jgi:hypothetical protein
MGIACVSHRLETDSFSGAAGEGTTREYDTRHIDYYLFTTAPCVT